MIQNLEELNNTFNEAFYQQAPLPKCNYCGNQILMQIVMLMNKGVHIIAIIIIFQ